MIRVLTYPSILLAFIVLEGINIAIWYFKQQSLRFLLYAALAFLAAIALAVYLLTGV